MTRSNSTSPNPLLDGSWMSWPPAAKQRLLARLQTERWRQTARTEQLPPRGDWRAWYLRGGRGSGKTRTGSETLAEWIRQWAFQDEPGDWAIVAPTFGDARDTCMEGPSGLLKARSGFVSRGEHWNRSMGELWLPNGDRVFCDGADDGALRIQGKNLRGAWCDEIGLWRDWDIAWNESLSFAVRLDPSLIVATGTPKAGHPLVAALLADEQVAKTHMRMLDNAANLHPAALKALTDMWAGTRRGRQELEGEFIEDVPGALWSLELIDRNRVDELPLTLDRIVVGVDPSGAMDTETGANSIGIVVCGFSRHFQQGYVIADYTILGGPEVWARQVCWAYDRHNADLVVAEGNYGRGMVKHTLHIADPSMPVKLVNARDGKAVRADPIALLYDQGKVHHLRGVDLSKLEDQMTSWVPPRPGERTKDSPDRMDALVWALTELMGGRGHASQITYQPGRGEEPVRRTGDLVLRGAKYVDAKPTR